MALPIVSTTVVAAVAWKSTLVGLTADAVPTVTWNANAAGSETVASRSSLNTTSMLMPSADTFADDADGDVESVTTSRVTVTV